MSGVYGCFNEIFAGDEYVQPIVESNAGDSTAEGGGVLDPGPGSELRAPEIEATDPLESARRVLRRGQDEFVSTWGQMGATWGIPRTMAEIHALLFIVGDPLCTDEIMGRLDISRGSASMSLKALLEWAIVSRTHKRGDRKEYFKAEQDVWKLFRKIIRERKRREIDPALASLRHCRSLTAELKDALESGPTAQLSKTVQVHNQRVDEMIDFLQMVDVLTDKFISPNGKGLRAAAGILGRVI